MRQYIALLITASLLAQGKSERASDRVTSIPGIDIPLKSKWYSGHYNVSSSYRHIHYLFIESLSNPATDPVLIFYNGGPGGASTLSAFTDLGPVIARDGSTNFADNSNYTWCRNASVIFVDNPSGVGYSYAQRDIDYMQFDIQFTRDQLQFLKQFYGDWPELYSNPLYIIGISYGGMYAPYMTWALHTYNQEIDLQINPKDKKFNIKGFIAANGVTDFDTDPYIGTMDTVFAFGIFSPAWIKSYKDNKCLYYWQGVKESYLPGPCGALALHAQETFRQINIYQLFQSFPLPITPTLQSSYSVGRAIVNGTERTYRRSFNPSDQYKDLMNTDEECINPTHTQLQGANILDFLNSEVVRTALHVDPRVTNYEFQSNKIFNNYKSAREASLWIYTLLNRYGYKTMHIMGDADGILSLQGAWKWVKKLGYSVTQPWTPWMSLTQDDLVGFIKQYGNFTLATVHGYGHDALASRYSDVPDLINKFIFNQPLP